MPNVNLLTNPAIEGNVSSCKTEITFLNGTARPNAFVKENTGYATNNCTGETDVFHSWSFSGTSIWLATLLSIVVIVISFRAWANSDY